MFWRRFGVIQYMAYRQFRMKRAEKTGSSQKKPDKAGRGRRERQGSKDRTAKHAFFPSSTVLSWRSHVRLSKILGALEKAEFLSSFQSYPAAYTVGAGRLKVVENLIFQSKNRFITVFASGSLKDFRENRQGGESLLPRLPACQNLFGGLSWRCHAILPPWACSPPGFRKESKNTAFAKRVGFFALRPETPRSRSRRRFSSARKKRLRAQKSGAKARRTVCFQNRALSGFMKPDVSTMSG